MFKQFLLISLFISSLFSIRAQEYSLVDEGLLWSSLQDNCTPGVTSYRSFFTRFKGDTLIGDKLYKKVQLAEDEDARQWNYTNEFVREENNRVYYLGNGLAEEFLLYDFNLETGEEVFVWNQLVPEGLKLQVVNVDSVFMFDGYRKRIELITNEFSSSEFWIEGVGSEYGLLNSGGGIFLGICGNYFLLCLTENDIQVYQNPNYQTCFYNLLGDEENELDKIEMIYNSVTKKVEISVPGNSTTRLMVTNISGVVLHRGTIDSPTGEIDFSFFGSGLFVVTAFRERSSLSKKILVN
jgi:hypothetical protein